MRRLSMPLLLVALCIGAGVAANVAWILGACELLGPEATAASLLTTLGIAVIWPIAVLWAIRRSIPTARWIVILVGTILLFGGTVVVSCCFDGVPWRTFGTSVRPVMWFVLSASGLAALWTLLIVLVTHRGMPVAQRCVVALGSIICWGGSLLAVAVFFWIPIARINPADSSDYADYLAWSGDPANCAEVRSVCHRALTWDTDPHDPFIFLGDVGDGSSVPYIVWGLRGMPAEEPRDCTWAHGVSALRQITNHSAGSTREAWVQWYAANKGRNCIEWWADGFAEEGYPVSVGGGEKSIRNLLAVLGRTPWCQSDDKPWLAFNARRMLDLMDKKDVRRAIERVLSDGSVPERCGAARYANSFERKDAEAILRRLTQDKERPVRLRASGTLCRLQLEWLKNPPGYIEKRLSPDDVSDQAFFCPPGDKVSLPSAGTQIDFDCTAKNPPHVRIEAVAASATDRDRPRCIIRVDWPNGAADWFFRNTGAVIGIEGHSPVTGKSVYSRDLMRVLDVSELRWVYDPGTDGLYISVPDYTCRVAPRTGQVVWEMGFGTDNCDELYVVGDYLIIYDGGLVVCDASRGGILARYGISGSVFSHNSLSVVNGRLRTKDSGDFYILTLPRRK